MKRPIRLLRVGSTTMTYPAVHELGATKNSGFFAASSPFRGSSHLRLARTTPSVWGVFGFYHDPKGTEIPFCEKLCQELGRKTFPKHIYFQKSFIDVSQFL